jgi:3-phosphoshikimate 1-carboxyvinyltransferase
MVVGEGSMELRLPGDKSISQRALILAGLAQGESRIRGILAGQDPESTADALRKVGVGVPDLGPEIVIRGTGLRGFRQPKGPLDLGNSGTGARLLLGVLAGQPLEAVLTGDESLRTRPMARVTDPLTAMGGRFEFLDLEGRLPLRVRGGDLAPFDYRLPVASAQVKTALLLAGLVGGVPVDLEEPGRSRDHTERMFSALGVPVTSMATAHGWRVTLSEPPETLPGLDLTVPADFSSAAFSILLGLLKQGDDPLVIRDVGLNETRTGLLPVLARMGAQLTVENRREGGAGEPLGDLVVRPSPLAATDVGGQEIPTLIDEVPVVAAAAARAEGTTRITGAEELRVKETDRIRAMVENLVAVGVEARELEDGLEIRGSERPLVGEIQSHGDHRIAMVFGVLGSLPENRISIVGRESSRVSFPGFWKSLERVAGKTTGEGADS